MDLKKLLGILTSASLLSADTLVLHNGSRIEGHFIGGSDQTIQFAVGGRVNTFNVSDVDSLRFSSTSSYPSAAATAPPAAYPPGPSPDMSGQPGSYPPVQSGPPPNGPGASGPYPSTPDSQTQPADAYPPYPASAPAPAANPGAPYPPSAPPASGVQIPAGTQVVIRLIDPVNSDQDTLGQTYRASVDQPVFVNGQLAIPRGADAVATLIDAQKSGKIQGRTVLTLDLKTVTLGGRSYDIVTTGVPQESSSRGKRSAEVIGGTAALGAIIGGLAGGGRGAAIGAGSGAAVGTAGQVLTSGQKVKVPAETRISFTLQNPLTL